MGLEGDSIRRSPPVSHIKHFDKYKGGPERAKEDVNLNKK